MRRALRLFVLLGAAACELQELSLAEPEDVVIVEAILRADDPVQKVLVQRSYGLGRPPVVDIRVTDEAGQEYRFQPAQPSVCLLPADTIGRDTSSCYWHVSLESGPFVREGRHYRMRVETEDGRVLTGETRVPGAFRIVEPASATCRLRPATTLDMTWTSSADAWVYIAETSLSGLKAALEPAGIEVPSDPLRLVGLSITREDTTIAFPAEFGLFDRFDEDLSDVLIALQAGLPEGVEADVVVGAADRNYVNWVRGGSFNPSGTVRVPSLLGEGGTGVFGSVVTEARTIVAAESGQGPAC